MVMSVSFCGIKTSTVRLEIVTRLLTFRASISAPTVHFSPQIARRQCPHTMRYHGIKAKLFSAFSMSCADRSALLLSPGRLQSQAIVTERTSMKRLTILALKDRRWCVYMDQEQTSPFLSLVVLSSRPKAAWRVSSSVFKIPYRSFAPPSSFGNGCEPRQAPLAI